MGLALARAPEVKRALFNGLPVFKLRCHFFLYGKKEKKENCSV